MELGCWVIIITQCTHFSLAQIFKIMFSQVMARVIINGKNVGGKITSNQKHPRCKKGAAKN